MNHNLFYKFRDFGENTDKIILNSEFYFSSPLSFNDPFDCNLSYRKFYSKLELEKAYEKYIKESYSNKELWDNGKIVGLFEKSTKILVERLGIFSMTSNVKEILMWSHYANEHKGLAFELDKNECTSFFEQRVSGRRILTPIKYQNNYELLSYFNDAEREAEVLLTYKHKSWEYEDEYRIIDFQSNGLKKFDKKLIKKIFFGVKADESNIKKTIQLCQLNGFKHLEFKKAKLIPGKFALDFEDIDKNKYLD